MKHLINIFLNKFFLSIFLITLSSFSIAKEEFKGIGGVTFGMNFDEVQDVIVNKNNWGLFRGKNKSIDGLNSTQVKYVISKGIEIAEGKWEIHFIFFDPTLKSEELLSKDARIIGFELQLRQIPGKLWVSEKYGNKIFSNIISSLYSKYSLDKRKLKIFSKNDDKVHIQKVKLQDNLITFSKKEGNTFINTLNRSTNSQKKNKEEHMPIHWKYEILIHKEFKSSKKTTL